MATASRTCSAGHRIPGAGELQNLEVAADPSLGAPAEPLYARLARRAQAWGPGGTVGLVVGATAPSELDRIRSVAPGLAFLVPGVGAQGGEVEPVLRLGPATASPAAPGSGRGLLVNISRGISGAAKGPGDVAEQIAAAARDWSERLSLELLAASEPSAIG